MNETHLYDQLGFLDQPDRTLVCRVDQKTVSTGSAPVSRGTGRGHQRNYCGT